MNRHAVREIRMACLFFHSVGSNVYCRKLYQCRVRVLGWNRARPFALHSGARDGCLRKSVVIHSKIDTK